MKKLIAMLLVAAFVCISTIGCGGDTKPAGGSGAGSTQKSTTEKTK